MKDIYMALAFSTLFIELPFALYVWVATPILHVVSFKKVVHRARV